MTQKQGANNRLGRRYLELCRSQSFIVIATGIAFTLAAVALIIVLFNFSVMKYDVYQYEVIDQLTREVTVTASRGYIYDKNGNILAMNENAWLLFISPKDIEKRAQEDETNKLAYASLSEAKRASYKESDITWKYELTDSNGRTRTVDVREYIATVLSDMFVVSYEQVKEKMAKTNLQYSVIQKEITDEQADVLRGLIKKYKLTAQIVIYAAEKRSYPKGDLASNVLGVIKSDGSEALYGIEKQYNDVLEGTSGKYVTARDAHSNDMSFEFQTYVAAENGCNVVTTLDMYIQYELENQLEQTCIESGGNYAVGIVMDVNTGGILGMAQYPTFDANDPYTLPEAQLNELLETVSPGDEGYSAAYTNALFDLWQNKSISILYEPGSTFKAVTASVALEENAVAVSDRFYCPGYLYVEGWGDIKCHRVAGHGSVNFAEGLQQSCNPVLMTVAERIGRDTFYKYFKSFGYTSRTGVDLPAEASGIYTEFENFHNVELAVYSFGQTFKTTPIQQLTAICAVANGGWLVTPHVMDHITDEDGNTVETYVDANKRQVISQATCDIVKQILEEGVAGNGGAKNAYVKGYRVAAKTGTSQKQDKYDEYGERPYRVGSCVAFAPADDPQVAVLILVDEPSIGSVYGSVVAAPYVSNLLGYILPYLGVEPQYTEQEQQNIEISVGNYIGATTETAVSDLGWRGINYEIIGDGDTITAQVPKSGSTLSKETGKLLLYTGEEAPLNDITVPDLVGKTAEAANRLLVNLGLNIKIEGSNSFAAGESATVISQSPAAGETVPRATVVTIELRHLNVTD